MIEQRIEPLMEVILRSNIQVFVDIVEEDGYCWGTTEDGEEICFNVDEVTAICP